MKLDSTINHLTYNYNPALNEQLEYWHKRNHSPMVQPGELQLHSEKQCTEYQALVHSPNYLAYSTA